MAIYNQSFLGSTPKSSSCKITFTVLLISFVALVSTTLFATQYFTKTTQFITTLTTTTTTKSTLKICDKSTNKEPCIAMVSEAAKEADNDNDNHLLKSFLKQTRPRIQEALDAANDLSRLINNPKDRAAVMDCIELLDMSNDRLTESLRTTSTVEDIHTWLSSVLTNHVTCLDGLEDGSPTKSLIEPSLKELILRARTSLAILVSAYNSSKTNENRAPVIRDDFPDWLAAGDRRLLGPLPRAVAADVVVAKDGSGKYKTVSEAVAAAPEESAKKFVIYVKKGTYKEKVEIGKNKKNLMIVGDGMDFTIITGSLNVVDGSTTFNSATVVVSGDGFIAQDICFQNTAGPQKHQAVALRVSADQCVINRCRIDAYQDTLYAHTNRQFYRDSSITGTVDFIFGDAAVVFQSCKLVPRKPMSGQKNMVTAQGRTDPNQNTGTSIQNCDIMASSDLQPVKAQFPTYLGRPWKEYSRTVVMQSNIGDVITPAGWSEWEKDFALKTLYYGEYANKGPGAGTSGRVKWPGYKIITSASEAQKFTVAQLIQGGSWLESTGVAYTEGL